MGGAMQGDEVFPRKTCHTIEHMYSSYPLDMMRIHPEHIPDIRYKDTLQVAMVCFDCSLQANRRARAVAENVGGVDLKLLDEKKQSGSQRIEEWLLKRMSGNGWTKEKRVEILENPLYGPGKLYTEVFHKFDVLIVSPKEGRGKLRYGSIQRITSQMRSGTPVLVEAKGLAFTSFLEHYNYTCAFSSKSNEKYQTLGQASRRIKDPLYRKDCQEQGLKISSHFSPNEIGKKLLRTLGYTGDFYCASVSEITSA